MYIEASDYSKKIECDSLDRLDIKELNKAGLLSKRGNWICECGSGFVVKISVFLSEISNHIVIKHKIQEADEIKDFETNIPLISAPCNFGGKRYWFACRMVRNGFCCDRKVGVLYRVGNYFACRHCHRLTYESKNRGEFNVDSFVAKPQSKIEQFSVEKTDEIYKLGHSENVFKEQREGLRSFRDTENDRENEVMPTISASWNDSNEFPEWEL
jgi:hypothetical protein